MAALVALSDARVQEESVDLPLAFKKRAWVPAFLFLVDVLTVQLALLLGFWLRVSLFVFWPTLMPSIGVFNITVIELAVAVLALPVVFAAIGLCPGYGLGLIERLRRRVSATVLFFGCLVVWDNIAQHGDWSRGIMLGTFGFAIMLMPLVGYLARRFLIKMHVWGLPVLIIGTGSKGRSLAKVLCAEPELGFVPVGFLGYETSASQPLLAGVSQPLLEGLPVLGDVSQASAFRNQVDTVIVIAPHDGTKTVGAITEELLFSRVIVVPDLSELPSLWVNTRDLGGMLALELRQNLLIRRNQLIKRVFDYLITVPFFVVSIPILVGAAICIKIASPGPAFFSQERDGLNGRRFRMWKLRTMHRDAEARMEELFERDSAARQEWKSHAKIRNDPRIIPGVGAWLRQSSLDELPQLWNVLRGDMSLVGPRPFVEYHLVLFSKEFREFRAKVRPGITGLWQVLKRNNGDIGAQQTLDTYYVRNWSPWMDIYILISTIPAVVSGRGAR